MPSFFNRSDFNRCFASSKAISSDDKQKLISSLQNYIHVQFAKHNGDCRFSDFVEDYKNFCNHLKDLAKDDLTEEESSLLVIYSLIPFLIKNHEEFSKRISSEINQKLPGDNNFCYVFILCFILGELGSNLESYNPKNIVSKSSEIFCDFIALKQKENFNFDDSDQIEQLGLDANHFLFQSYLLSKFLQKYNLFKREDEKLFREKFKEIFKEYEIINCDGPFAFEGRSKADDQVKKFANFAKLQSYFDLFAAQDEQSAKRPRREVDEESTQEEDRDPNPSPNGSVLKVSDLLNRQQTELQ